jgi:hypothetical protein
VSGIINWLKWPAAISAEFGAGDPFGSGQKARLLPPGTVAAAIAAEIERGDPFGGPAKAWFCRARLPLSC